MSLVCLKEYITVLIFLLLSMSFGMLFCWVGCYSDKYFVFFCPLCMDIDLYTFFDCLFLCEFSFAEFLEGGWVHRALLTFWSSLLRRCFCRVLRKSSAACFLRFPHCFLSSLSHFYLHLLFPLPPLSLPCSVLGTFLTVSPSVGPFPSQCGGLRAAG